MTTSLDMIRGRSNIVTMTNNSGGALIAGDVCIQDTTADENVTTTTSAASTVKVFIAAESIGIGASGKFYESGYCPFVNVSASATRGYFLFTHTVAKQAASASGYAAGAFGRVLKAGTSPSAIIYSATAQVAGSGTIGGASGSTDNAIIRADGTGGSTIQSSLATVDDSGTVNIPTGQTYNINNTPHTHASSGGLLALTQYLPGGSAVIYTINSATAADVDATNLSVTFTAPASGNVLVRLSAFMDMPALGDADWGLRESTTNLTGSYGHVMRSTTDAVWISYCAYVSGISAGSHTYKWGAAMSANSFRIIVNDGAVGHFGGAVMEVWAAP